MALLRLSGAQGPFVTGASSRECHWQRYQAAALQMGMSSAPSQVLGSRAEASGRGRGLEPALSLRGHWGESLLCRPSWQMAPGGGALRGFHRLSLGKNGVISRPGACEMARAAFEVWLARQGAR